jgi:hypothetical protein
MITQDDTSHNEKLKARVKRKRKIERLRTPILYDGKEVEDLDDLKTKISLEFIPTKPLK